jgi:tetratricopeptide (TPR) repeat protein
MIRLDLRTSIWIALILTAAHGCKGTQPTDPGASEPTSGGETTGDAADTEGAPSPWGATRAEQCETPPRPSFSQRAARDLAVGVVAAQANDLDGAEQSFQSALQRDGSAYPALYNLGVVADRRGDESRAIELYQRALRLVPDYAPAARGIAIIHLRRGEPREAVAVVEPLANEYRANLEMQALYAEMLVEAKRFEEAWMAARRALKCDEKFVPALIALSKASRAQGRDELADSILDQALQIDPDVAELHFLDGERLKSEPGRLRDSMAAYERAVQLRPDYAEARMALGIQLLAGGNYESALGHFEAARQLVPTLPAVHVNLGDAYRATEQWNEAQAAYRRALALQSPLPEAHYGLALLFLTAGGEFPGLDELTAYQKAVDELKTYRAEMGARLSKDDQSTEYLQDLDRMIKRTRRRMEREQGGTS